MYKLMSENYLKYIEPVVFRLAHQLFKLTSTNAHSWLLTSNNLRCDSAAPVDPN